MTFSIVRSVIAPEQTERAIGEIRQIWDRMSDSTISPDVIADGRLRRVHLAFPFFRSLAINPQLWRFPANYLFSNPVLISFSASFRSPGSPGHKTHTDSPSVGLPGNRVLGALVALSAFGASSGGIYFDIDGERVTPELSAGDAVTWLGDAPHGSLENESMITRVAIIAHWADLREDDLLSQRHRPFVTSSGEIV